MASSGRDSSLNGSGTDSNQSLHQRLTEVSQAQDHLNLPTASLPSSLRKSLADEPSGTATPLSEDAPPSLHATSAARQQIRAAHKRREFPSIEFQARLSHFDPASDYHDFRGFFVLFWIGLAIMVITAMLRNMKETGWPFVFRQRQLFVENIWELLSSDAVMMASTLLNVPLHRLYASSTGSLRWKTGGVWVQTAFQAAWLIYWVQWPFMRKWTWTAQVFFTLHLLCLFMKMHSYAFYSGYLSETKRRLDDLDNPEVGSVRRVRTPLVRYPSTTAHIADIRKLQEENVKAPGSKTVTELREDLAREITSPLGNVTYPANVSYYNFIDFLCCPTLCYEIEYPRTNSIRTMELVWKGLAVFGCIFLMTLTTEEFVLPVLDEARVLLLSANSFTDAALIFAETISRLLFPFMVIFLLLFLALFEYLCNFFAEVTRFADRRFYSDWWNSCDWLEFSREWNVPVHHFFRRHVYSASLTVMSRPVATVITFFISALAHELVMGCITKKLRGYGAFALLLQMPLVVMQRSKWMRGRQLLNNVLFWISMISGLSIMCALYVLL